MDWNVLSCMVQAGVDKTLIKMQLFALDEETFEKEINKLRTLPGCKEKSLSRTTSSDHTEEPLFVLTPKILTMITTTDTNTISSNTAITWYAI